MTERKNGPNYQFQKNYGNDDDGVFMRHLIIICPLPIHIIHNHIYTSPGLAKGDSSAPSQCLRGQVAFLDDLDLDSERLLQPCGAGLGEGEKGGQSVTPISSSHFGQERSLLVRICSQRLGFFESRGDPHAVKS